MTELIQRFTASDIRAIRFKCKNCKSVVELLPEKVSPRRVNQCQVCGIDFDVEESVFVMLPKLIRMLRQASDISIEFEVTPPDTRAG